MNFLPEPFWKSGLLLSRENWCTLLWSVLLLLQTIICVPHISSSEKIVYCVTYYRMWKVKGGFYGTADADFPINQISSCAEEGRGVLKRILKLFYSTLLHSILFYSTLLFYSVLCLFLQNPRFHFVIF